MKEPGITVHFRQQFIGKIRLNDELLSVHIRLSFFLREINNQVIAQLYSSVSFDNENFISGHQNQLYIEKGIIQPAFIIIFNKREYQVKLEIKLKNLTDFTIGLEGKTAKAWFSESGNDVDACLLYQPASNRLKNAFYLNTKMESGWLEKRKAKLRILKTLFKG